jgi:hypothetical protein
MAISWSGGSSGLNVSENVLPLEAVASSDRAPTTQEMYKMVSLYQHYQMLSQQNL